MTRAKLNKLSVCKCGFSLLDENIPLGTEYKIDPADREPISIICGNCDETTRALDGVFVFARTPGQRNGYLPIEIFELDP